MTDLESSGHSIIFVLRVLRKDYLEVKLVDYAGNSLEWSSTGVHKLRPKVNLPTAYVLNKIVL